jgi:hypothetical protein
MKTVVGFVVGAIVGAVVVALLLGGGGRSAKRRDGVWRERAETMERELNTARRQRDAIGEELRQLTERFDTLGQRFEALAAVTPAPSGSTRVPDEQWDALVTGGVNTEIARRLTSTMPAAKLQALLASVQAAREKSRVLIATATVAGGNEQAQLEAERSAILQQVDDAFQEQLGIGLNEFMHGTDPQPSAG